MTPLLHSVASWWTGHPGWVNFIYFALCVFVAIYTDATRRVLTAPVWLPIKRMAIWMERDLDNRIAVLNYMHTDTYHLVHYVAYYICHALMMALRCAIGLAIFTAIVERHGDSRHFLPYIGWMFVTLVTVRLYKLYETLGYLFNYEESIGWMTDLQDKHPRVQSKPISAS